MAAGTAAIAALGLASTRSGDLIVYNHSPSMPIGFYLRVDAPIAQGAIVTVRARDATPAIAQARGFDGDSDRFIKRVAASGGDRVCAEGDAVVINGAHHLSRAARNGAGRALPAWSGCVRLASDQVFLLGDTPDSFDARYWGPVSRDAIEGVWAPLRF